MKLLLKRFYRQYDKQYEACARLLWSMRTLVRMGVICSSILAGVSWLYWLIYSPVPQTMSEWLFVTLGMLALFVFLYNQWHKIHWMSRALTEKESRFQQIVEASPHAMLIVARTSEIVLVNAQTEAMFGYSRQELLGKRIEILVPLRCYTCYQEALQKFIADPQETKEIAQLRTERTLYGKRRDGTEFPLELNLACVRGDIGRIALISMVDISERHAIEQAFRLQAEQVALASRYKSEFLANMSHELRTPLNSIIVLSEQLREGVSESLSPTYAESIGIIHKSGEDLLALINDVLDLSCIEAGKIPVRPERVLLSEFAHTLRATFLPLAQNKSLELTLDIEAHMADEVSFDLQRVSQIVRNLLSNAIKFTDHGKVHMRIFSEGETRFDNLATFSIAITDTGPGIPEEKQTLIFEAFQQGDGSTNRRFGGSGLGLAISKQLAGLIGGQISVKSFPGLGSTFTLTLPLMPLQGYVKQAHGAGENDEPDTSASVASMNIRTDGGSPEIMHNKKRRVVSGLAQPY